jgi:hypothetical protein
VAMWDRVFELILRLKGNAVIVGTAAYPDERSMELACRRGLYLAEHHITLLGTNTFQWPKGVPYSFAKSRETLEYTWRAVAEQQKHRKMLWTVGYRGLNDYPFWRDDTSFTTDAARGQLISEAMVAQAAVVRNVTRDPNPPMFTCVRRIPKQLILPLCRCDLAGTYLRRQTRSTCANTCNEKELLLLLIGDGACMPMRRYLWSEMTPLYTEGHLKIPEGVRTQLISLLSTTKCSRIQT